ncbi:hypothetical protein ACM66B_005727 [Microbotryomycetes sp. NB124-2]
MKHSHPETLALLDPNGQAPAKSAIHDWGKDQALMKDVRDIWQPLKLVIRKGCFEYVEFIRLSSRLDIERDMGIWAGQGESQCLTVGFQLKLTGRAEDSFWASVNQAKDRDSDSDDCRSDLNTLRRAYEEVRHWWRHDYFKIVGLLENEQVLPRHIQEQIKVCRAVNYDRATSNPCSDSIANDYRLCIDRVSKLDEKYRADYEVHAYVQNLVAVLKGTTMKDADSWNALFRRQPAAVNKLIEAARALKKSVSSRGCLVVRGRTPDQPLPQVWQQPSSVNTKREGRVGYRSGNPSNLSTRSDPNLRISFGANRFVVPPFTLSSSSTWPDGGRQASAAYASGRRG